MVLFFFLTTGTEESYIITSFDKKQTAYHRNNYISVQCFDLLPVHENNGLKVTLKNGNFIYIAHFITSNLSVLYMEKQNKRIQA